MTIREDALRERAEKIRPDIEKARKITMAAHNEGREMTEEEKAIVEPILQQGNALADAMAKHRADENLMAKIRDEFGALGGSGTGSKSGSD